jgi:hypothetical protein
MDLITKSYVIPDRNFGEFQFRIAKLAKRAARLGVGEITYSSEERSRTDAKTGRVYLSHAVTLTGAAPKLAGWTFVATLQHAGEAGNILRAVPGAEVPESFRTAAPNCDHCKAARMRRETFLVKSDAGELKQVGRQCVADFLGHADPQKIASLCEIWAEVGGLCEDAEGEDWRSGGRARERWDLLRFLTCTACAMRNYGWISRTKARESNDPLVKATASHAFSIMSPSRDQANDPKFPRTNAEDAAEADRALAWFEAEILPKEAKSDYEHNLSVISRMPSIDPKAFGLAASLIMIHRRAVGAALELGKRAAVSQHFGEVGKRAEFTLTVTMIREFESNFGVTKLHKFLDAQGNEAVWFASREKLRQGSTYVVKATVKAHNARDGVKQTVLTRCTVITVDGKPPCLAPEESYRTGECQCANCLANAKAAEGKAA